MRCLLRVCRYRRNHTGGPFFLCCPCTSSRSPSPSSPSPSFPSPSSSSPSSSSPSPSPSYSALQFPLPHIFRSTFQLFIMQCIHVGMFGSVTISKCSTLYNGWTFSFSSVSSLAYCADCQFDSDPSWGVLHTLVETLSLPPKSFASSICINGLSRQLWRSITSIQQRIKSFPAAWPILKDDNFLIENLYNTRPPQSNETLVLFDNLMLPLVLFLIFGDFQNSQAPCY